MWTQRYLVRRSHWRCALATVALGSVIVLAAHAQSDLSPLVGRVLSGRVTSVVDGDTVHVTLEGGRAVTVRLEGIDCPETGEPFSIQARNTTRVMLFNKQVQLKATDIDPYGRLVARVASGDGDSSVTLVRAGLACHFTRYSSDSALAAAQVEAKAHARGFWAPGAQRPACVARNEVATARGVPSGPFHGNAQSRVYHAASCRNYNCRNCTVPFRTETDAQRAGFAPASDCLR